LRSAALISRRKKKTKTGRERKEKDQNIKTVKRRNTVKGYTSVVNV